MGQALYRTYRSKKLAEIVGQEHITTALGHALKKGTISHAYLFTGPRGVGKTSIARILAHEINKLPYDEGRMHLDIIEIDAASNRRIDEIRDLRDKVHIAPASAKYKVYIIDEAHMLTKEAFNALLKTLEEPPAHAVFILATTEAHKLPETIISRTQRFTFKPVDQQKVVDHLRHIAKQEKIAVTDDALALIAAHGEGSFRDSISLLDQVRNQEGEVGLAEVQAVLGIAPEKLIHDIADALSAHSSVDVAKHLQTMHEQGYEAAQIAKQLGSVFRQRVIDGEAGPHHEVQMKLLADLVQVPASPDPRVTLEIALLDAALAGSGEPFAASKPAATFGAASAAAAAPPASPKVMSEEVATKPAIQIPAKRTEKQKSETQAVAATPDGPDPVTPLDASEVDSGLTLTGEAWKLILNALKRKHNTLFSMINSAQAHFEPGKVTLEFGYAFHQKRINESRNKEILSAVIQGVTGSDMQIVCIVGTGKPRIAPTTPMPSAEGEIAHSVSHEIAVATPSPTPDTAPPATVNTISDIFGGAEVLES
jgi:DNA polymerase-3 subunit gamma/tau